MRNFLLLLLMGGIGLAACRQTHEIPAVEEEPQLPKVVVAYVTSWTSEMPDPSLMTHINYSFGHVNNSFNGVRIDNEKRLAAIVEHRNRMQENLPDSARTKIMLSIGGWGSGRFSEMVSDSLLRNSFCMDCRRIVEEFGLDGIDIDWEYPGSNLANISYAPTDSDNFSLLMRDLRSCLGDGYCLTMASAASAKHVNFPDFIGYMDFVNIMAYDMANAPYHHSALYDSEISGSFTSSKAVQAHLEAGVPKHKLVLGVPFYGRGGRKNGQNYVNFNVRDIDPAKYELCWSGEAMVPYIRNKKGEMVFGLENQRSLGIKCDYVLEQGLRGIMYWDYACNDADLSQSRLLAKKILDYPASVTSGADYAGNRVRFKALVYYTEHAEEAHVQFAHQSIEFFKKLAVGNGFSVETCTDLCKYGSRALDRFDLIISVNAAPQSGKERTAFRNYMENGGGWIGFHAAAYNDAGTNWPWFLDFIGGGRFLCNNWPPQPALVQLDTLGHPVTRNLPAEFVIPASEYYQWTPSPRQNPDVDVLLSISPKNYPMGLKDIVYDGDWPLVWTNRKYRMIYLNMGHGDEEFTDATQNLLFVNALQWITKLND
ncbi:MAG: glycosyl hydrolase family 18 protein [Bacteroidales bacterium]|nr:glycosyl hydrolase family 18 protein [Bacteroidales bacterium]